MTRLRDVGIKRNLGSRELFNRLLVLSLSSSLCLFLFRTHMHMHTSLTSSSPSFSSFRLGYLRPVLFCTEQVRHSVVRSFGAISKLESAEHCHDSSGDGRVSGAVDDMQHAPSLGVAVGGERVAWIHPSVLGRSAGSPCAQRWRQRAQHQNFD